jgi:hypothetical protein
MTKTCKQYSHPRRTNSMAKTCLHDNSCDVPIRNGDLFAGRFTKRRVPALLCMAFSLASANVTPPSLCNTALLPFVQVYVNMATASQCQVSPFHSFTRSLSSPFHSPSHPHHNTLHISASSSSPAIILYRSLLSAYGLPSGIVDSYLRSCTSLFHHHQSCSLQSLTQQTRSSKPRTLLLTFELRPAF